MVIVDLHYSYDIFLAIVYWVDELVHGGVGIPVDVRAGATACWPAPLRCHRAFFALPYRTPTTTSLCQPHRRCGLSRLRAYVSCWVGNLLNLVLWHCLLSYVVAVHCDGKR